jgi:hypothetical protein
VIIIITVSVFEEAGEGLTRELSRYFANGDVRFGVFDAADVAVVSPNCRTAPRAVCLSLLTPGDAVPRRVRARRVVTYGFSPRDTLTFSSLLGRQAMLDVRREIVNARGEVVDAGEVAVAPGDGTRRALALYGALILLGLIPGETT